MDTIEVDRKWLEVLLQYTVNARKELDSNTLYSPAFWALVGFTSSAETIINNHQLGK